jgi:2-polyprenyl-6-methoxyphenol hydroxylase-like FAD-dependent oxidoreductase
MRRLSSPILIVGGAASGMALANDLGYRDVECMVIEQGTGVIQTPKTGHISARTMEHCRRWGFVDQVWNSGFPRDLPLDTVLCTSLAGYELTRKPTPSIEETRPLSTSPENRVRCPQVIFDPLLAARAQDHGSVSVHYQWRFERYETGDAGEPIVAHVSDLTTGEDVRVECKYLIGADGANSVIRKQADIALHGNQLLNYQLMITTTKVKRKGTALSDPRDSKATSPQSTAPICGVYRCAAR